jgi:hypothetical protein
MSNAAIMAHTATTTVAASVIVAQVLPASSPANPMRIAPKSDAPRMMIGSAWFALEVVILDRSEAARLVPIESQACHSSTFSENRGDLVKHAG